MANISAPYNFVPLNKQVFFPAWAPFVNHDIPFKDGLSGTLELKITAESPIFIRGEEEENDEDPTLKQYRFSKDHKGRHFIPGSSIRNMLRSVVEIMSFSKLNVINNYEKIGFRDMENPNNYTLRRDISETLYYGWLFKDANNNIHITKIDQVGDLRYKQDHTINIKGDSRFKNLGSNYRNNLLQEAIPSLKKKYTDYTNEGNFDSAINYSDDTDNVVVLTGYISGKTHEFEFARPTFESDYEISSEKFEDFMFANPILQENNLWGFWKNKFESNQPIPIFFRLENNDEEVLDFGLTVLYRMTYKNSVIDLLKQNQPEYNDKRKDLVETIFGTIDNTKLKGRVQVEHAFSDSNSSECEKYNLVLAKPNHSFYPNYIKQNTNNQGGLIGNYKTLSDDNATISGRKRYPIHNRFQPLKINQDEPENNNVTTSFYPLRKNSSFKTKINYHNLLPVELGAILSAITFHNSKTCKHNIGSAKPYGFGKIEIKISGIEEGNIKNYLGLYEATMNQFCSQYNISWLESEQLKELLSMSFDFEGQDTEKLKYMKITDFKDVKQRKLESRRDAERRLHRRRVANNERLVINEKQGLPLYSNFMLNGNGITPKSIATSLTFDNSKYLKFNKIKSKTEEFIKKINSINSKINKLKEISNTRSTPIDESYKQGQEIEAVITSLKPKKANVNINGNLKSVGISFPKGINIESIKEGQIVIATISQIKKNGEINQLKFKSKN